MRVLADAGPVSGAEVHVHRHVGRASGSDPWRVVAAGRTDGAGLFWVDAAPGAYLVTASATGFARAYARKTHPVGEATTALDLRLQVGEAISGRTLDRRSGAAVPLATLYFAPALVRRAQRTLMPVAERAFATSNERGRFELAGLSAGCWQVEARAPGYAIAYQTLDVPRAGELRVELVRAGVIEGRVTRGGNPVAGATVTVTGPTEPVVVLSGQSGGFSAEVEPGAHHVFAQLGDESGSVDGVVAVPSLGTARVEIRLGAAAAIGGAVRSLEGPVANAVVTASLRGDEGGLGRAVTAADGAYELAGLAPGTYVVVVTVGDRPRASVPAFTVRAGERFPLNVLIEEAAAVAGTVTDWNGVPVSGARVTASGGRLPGGPAGHEALTDASGRYRIGDLSAGRIRVAAARDEASPVTSQTVRVEDGTTANVDLVLADGGSVAGVVLDAHGNAIPGAKVVAVDPDHAGRAGDWRATADAAGGYVLVLPVGRHGLSARFPGRRAAAAVPKLLATIDVHSGSRVEVDLLVSEEPDGDVTGRVLEPGGAPSPGAAVRAGPAGATASIVQADGEGWFVVSAPVDAPTALAARNGGRTATVTVTPPAGDVILQLEPAATVQGRLTGEPPPDSFTLSWSTPGAVPQAAAPSTLQFAGDTFTLSDVVPGRISLHVRTADFRVGAATVSAGAGELRQVEIGLSPATRVTGRVIDALTGQPIARCRIFVDGQGRGATGATGVFARTVPVGDHEIGLVAPGYVALTRAVTARGQAPTDLGNVALTPSAGRAGATP